MQLRETTATDRAAIQQIHRAAFPEGEREVIVALVDQLLAADTDPPTLSLLAELQGEAAGHLVFSPVFRDKDTTLAGYILAPLGVDPARQRQGVGAGLINAGLQRLSAAGVARVFVYGDPAYYGRFGFCPEAAARYRPPHPLQFPFGWQALALREQAEPQAHAPVTIRCVAALSDPALW